MAVVALETCPECERLIANSAEHCPNCGASMGGKGWKKSEIISAVSAIIAAASAFCAFLILGIGVIQYKSSENWKERELVATQIKEFHADKINAAVMIMADYDPACIELFPHKKEVEDRYVEVDFETIIRSFEKEKDFSEIEFEVRKYFEHFLQSLSRFDYYVLFGTIKPGDLCEFGYVVGIMKGNDNIRKMKLKNGGLDIAPFAKAVDDYLNRWEYWAVKDFLKRISDACG
jgi:RNA polymerase subunit RPABC4/transcription elongation factor Spt4